MRTFFNAVFPPRSATKPHMVARTIRARRITVLILTSVLLGSMLRTSGAPVRALGGDTHTHDPSMTRSGDCYYVFSTGADTFNHGNIQIRRSCDFAGGWALLGTVFTAQPAWIRAAIGSTPGNLWAPDISNVNGQWRLYYAASTFGSNRSVIGLAIANTIEGPWSDAGEVFRSTTTDTYNAIDPESAWTITDGQRDEQWLLFGSFWNGIKMRQIDPSTGKLLASNPTLYALASRGGGAIEAASVAWHNGYYYLFVSFDACCQGITSTYNIRVGRAAHITGPYLDHHGRSMLDGGGTQLLAGSGTMIGPGGADIFLDGAVYRMVHHFYDATANGDFKLAIRTLNWTDDWPTIGAGL